MDIESDFNMARPRHRSQVAKIWWSHRPTSHPNQPNQATLGPSVLVRCLGACSRSGPGEGEGEGGDRRSNIWQTFGNWDETDPSPMTSELCIPDSLLLWPCVITNDRKYQTIWIPGPWIHLWLAIDDKFCISKAQTLVNWQHYTYATCGLLKFNTFKESRIPTICKLSIFNVTERWWTSF